MSTSSFSSSLISYPSNQIRPNSSRIDLLKQFCIKCYSNEIVRRGTLKTLVVDQMANLLYFWQLWLQVIFVDHV